jgi:hypothetical protein
MVRQAHHDRLYVTLSLSKGTMTGYNVTLSLSKGTMTGYLVTLSLSKGTYYIYDGSTSTNRQTCHPELQSVILSLSKDDRLLQ